MALTLITGPAGSGKRGRTLEECRQALASGRSPLVVVPSVPDSRRLLAELSGDGLVGVRVRSLAEFVGEAWEEYGDGRAHVASAQRACLMRRAVADDPGGVLASGGPGAVRLMAELVSRQGVTFLPGSARGRSATQALIADASAKAVSRYRSLLGDEGLVESADALRIIADADRIGSGPVLFVDFLCLDSSLAELIDAWSGKGCEITVTLPWDEGVLATASLSEQVRRLGAAANTWERRAVEPLGTHPDLVERARGLFTGDPPRRPSDAVVFRLAEGEQGEADVVAAEARKLLERVPPERLAIVFGDVAKRIAALRRAFDARGIAIEIETAVPLVATRLGRALTNLLRAAADGDREALTAFLASPYSGVDAKTAELIDSECRKRRPADLEGLILSARERSPRAADALATAASLMAEGFSRGAEGWRGLTDSLLEARHTGALETSGTSLEEDGAAQRTTRRLLDEVAALSFSAEIGGREALLALERTRVGSGGSGRADHVLVTDARALGSRCYDAVILGGLTSDELTLRTGASPLEGLASRLTPQATDFGDPDGRLRFYHLITRTRQHLTLVRQAYDDDGQPKRPSIFWESMEGPPNAAATDSPMESGAEAGNAEGRAGTAQGASASAPRMRQAANADVPYPTPVARGTIRDESVLEDLASRESFSATEIESYLRCPYRWFYERTVRPRPADGTIGPMETGRLAHSVLKSVYERLPDRTGARRVTPHNLMVAVELAEERFDEAVAGGEVLPPASVAEEEALAKTRSWVLDLVTRDATFLPGFEPMLLEWSFGTMPTSTQGADPAAKQERRPGEGAVRIGSLQLSGSVDRVDAGDAGAVVSDYKRGAPPPRTHILEGRVVQVALYALVVEQELGLPVVGALYRSLSAGEARGAFCRTSLESGSGLRDKDGVDDIGAVLGAALQSAERAAEGIRAGRIAPGPSSSGDCRRCPARTVCDGRVG